MGDDTVPGLALIDTLPLVWQTVVLFVWSQFGRASTVGATTTATTAKPAINSTDFPESFICRAPFDLQPTYYKSPAPPALTGAQPNNKHVGGIHRLSAIVLCNNIIESHCARPRIGHPGA